MASVLSRIQIILEANTANYNNELRRARENSDSTFKKMGKAAGKLALGAGVAIAGLGATSLKVAGNFEAAMNGVRAVSNATDEDFTKLRDTAKELGASTAFSATEAANGMEFLAMSGMKTEQILSTIPNALSLAAAGSLDLASSADILSNIMTGIGLKADESGRAADVLAQAAASSNVDINMLGESMKYVAPIAKQLGMSLEETAAMVGVLGNAGIQGSEAGTALRSVYARFATHDKALGHFKAMGINIKDASGEMKSMTTLTGELAVAMKDMGADERLAVFKEMAGTEAMSALAVSVDAMAEGSLPKLAKELENSEGAAKKMADIRMEGLNGQLKGLASAWEGFLIELSDGGMLAGAADAVGLLTKGLRELTSRLPETVRQFKEFIDNIGLVDGLKSAFDNLVSVFKRFGEILAPVVNWFKEHNKLTEALALALPIVVAAMVTFTAATWLGAAAMTALGTVMAVVLSPITLAIVGLTALTAAGIYLYQNWDSIKAKASEVWDSIKNKVTETVDSIKAKFTAMVANSSAQFKTLVAVFTAIFNTIKVVVTTALNLISNAFKTGFNVIKALVRGDMKGVVDAIKSGFSNAVKIAANGISGLLNVFKTLGSKLYQIGKDAIQGFINGIKEKFAGALTLASGFVNSIKNVFTRAKGFDIHSPSRQMKKIGKNVVEGFTIGIQESMPKAVAASEAMVSAIKASFSLMKNYAVTQKDFHLANAVAESNKSVISSIQTLRKEIVLFGNDSKLAAFEYEVAFGSLKHASKEYVDEYRKGLIEIARLEEQQTANDTAKKSLQERMKLADAYYKSQQQALKTLSDSLLTEDEKRIELLRTQLALIEAMADATEASAMASKLLNDGSVVTEYKALYKDDTTAGQDNLAKIQQDNLDSELEYNRKLAILTALERTAEVQQTINDLEANQAAKRIQIAKDEVEAHKAMFQERLEFTGQGYAALGGLVKAFTGENSKASKAMFAIQKAHTLATILLKSKEALAQAWASAPFPNNLGAVAMAALKTGALQAAAGAISPSLSGQAHNGLDYVPKEGTYLLDEGERVIKPTENKKLGNFLDKAEGKGIAPNITTNVTIASDGKTDISSNHAMGKELGNAINAAIQKTLIKELRQGGLLSK